MAYPQYFMPPHPHHIQFPPPVPPQHREPGMPQPSPLAMDASMSQLFAPDFFSFQPMPQQHQQHPQLDNGMMHQLPAPLSASPPSSDGSSSPHDIVSGQSNGNGKRPPPAPSSSVSGSRKKARKSDKNTVVDDDSTDIITNNGDNDSKVKPTRGSR